MSRPIQEHPCLREAETRAQEWASFRALHLSQLKPACTSLKEGVASLTEEVQGVDCEQSPPSPSMASRNESPVLSVNVARPAIVEDVKLVKK